MYPIFFEVGPFTIYSLGLFWALGALAAVWILRLELKRYGYDPELAASVVLAAAIAGLLGARLLFIFEEWESFTHAPFELVFSGAGFSWYGGLIGGAIAVAWIFKKHRMPLARAADMSAPALALAYGIGRIGCFLAGDATWGKVNYRRPLGHGLPRCSRWMGRSGDRCAISAWGEGTSDAAL